MSQSTDDNIRNIPSFAKMQKEVGGMQTISKIVVFLERLGIRHDKISEAMQQVPDIAKQMEELLSVPDQFNRHFAQLGWVAHESMNFDLMKKAVELAADGDYDAAEALLVEQYNNKTIRFMLIRMRSIPEFRPRERLLMLAVEDYAAERYHACIPVVLSNIDGLTSDIEQKGFFAEGTNLTAWDSIAAHSSGLQALAKLFSKNRPRTTCEAITIPYRNGILHGRDLSYDNKIVAAKAWSTLFAVHDWIVALRKPVSIPQPTPSLRELLQQIKEIQEEKERFAAWKARTVIIGTDVPAIGSPEDFVTGTPERALVEFITFWANRNYGKMAQLLYSLHQQETESKTSGWVRQLFSDVTLIDFSILAIEDFAASVTTIETSLTYLDRFGAEQNKNTSIRLIYEGENGKEVARGNPKGKWRLLITQFVSGF